MCCQKKIIYSATALIPKLSLTWAIVCSQSDFFIIFTEIICNRFETHYSSLTKVLASWPRGKKWYNMLPIFGSARTLVLEIGFCPPTIWASQKARQFCHVNFHFWGRFTNLFYVPSQNFYPIQCEYFIFVLFVLPESCLSSKLFGFLSFICY